MKTKICSCCHTAKPISEYYHQKGHKFGVMSRCKDCFNKACVTRWRERKKKYIQLLGGECELCGVKFNGSNYSIFDFHHIDPSSKEYVWSKLRLLSDDKIKEELSKCVLLCSNCHRLVHSE